MKANRILGYISRKRVVRMREVRTVLYMTPTRPYLDVG